MLYERMRQSAIESALESTYLRSESTYLGSESSDIIDGDKKNELLKQTILDLNGKYKTDVSVSYFFL